MSYRLSDGPGEGAPHATQAQQTRQTPQYPRGHPPPVAASAAVDPPAVVPAEGLEPPTP